MSLQARCSNNKRASTPTMHMAREIWCNRLQTKIITGSWKCMFCFTTMPSVISELIVLYLFLRYDDVDLFKFIRKFYFLKYLTLYIIYSYGIMSVKLHCFSGTYLWFCLSGTLLFSLCCCARCLKICYMKKLNIERLESKWWKSFTK